MDSYKFPQRLSVFKKLLDKVDGRLLCGSDKKHLERSLKTGNGIPDRYKPGKLLESLDAEERKLLSELTSDDLRSIRFDEIDKFRIEHLK